MKSIKTRWSALICLSSMGMSACVSPYVKTPVPSSSARSCNDPYIANDGIRYAECTRAEMERKAGNYAKLNSGGATFLITLAGLATYRAFRGNNAANVAALATGGAAFYGVQQYLYEKPREGIYFAGAAALGCAIGVTRRRIDPVPADLRSQVESDALINDAQAKKSALDAYAHLVPDASCPVELQNEWKSTVAKVAMESGPDPINALRARHVVARQKVHRLDDIQRAASDDLVTITDNVRAAVNRQLTLLQPDPAEIATTIAGLKFTTLAGPEVKVATETKDATKSAPDTSSQVTALEMAEPALDAISREVRAPCNIKNKISGFTTAANNWIVAHAQARDVLTILEDRIENFESGTGKGGIKDLETTCPVGRSGITAPFQVVLAQSGPQKIEQGGTINIGIEGGVPPYTAVASAAADPHALTAETKLADDGSYQFAVKAKDNVPPNTYAMIATDGAGVTRVFQIQVVSKPKKD